MGIRRLPVAPAFFLARDGSRQRRSRLAGGLARRCVCTPNGPPPQLPASPHAKRQVAGGLLSPAMPMNRLAQPLAAGVLPAQVLGLNGRALATQKSIAAPPQPPASRHAKRQELPKRRHAKRPSFPDRRLPGRAGLGYPEGCGGQRSELPAGLPPLPSRPGRSAIARNSTARPGCNRPVQGDVRPARIRDMTCLSRTAER